MLLLLVLGWFNPSVKAQEYRELQARIPVFCRQLPTQENITCEIALEPKDARSPAPDQNQLTITGQGRGNFTVTVCEPGIYSYRVYEKPGKDASVLYDPRSYEVDLIVTNNEQDELAYSLIAKTEETGNKTAELGFTNGSFSEEESRTEEVAATGETTEMIRTGDHLVWAPLWCILLGSGALIVVLLKKGKKAEVYSGDL